MLFQQPIHHAAKAGQAEYAALLLSTGSISQGTLRDGQGCTPLSLACIHGHVECVQIMVNAVMKIRNEGEMLDTQDKQGRAAMHHAAGAGLIYCPPFLLYT